MRTVRLELMRPDEICQVLSEKSIAYLPVGPLEWHGPAMPYGTDAMAAYTAFGKMDAFYWMISGQGNWGV